jgi:hypothetical protein
MKSENIIAILALITGVGVYFSTSGGSPRNTQTGGKTFKRGRNKVHRRKTLSTKK